MGLRFRKSVKILPGVRINFNKKSTSISIGKRGARYTVSSTGKKTATVGIPGTGISYSQTINTKKGSKSERDMKPAKKEYSAKTYKVCSIIFYIICAISLLIGIPTFSMGGFIFVIFAAVCLYVGICYSKVSKQKLAQKDTDKPEI